jgi:hypothetical protein
MSKKIFSTLAIFYWVINMPLGLASNVSRYVTLSQVQTRAVAMGGAYAAVEDHLAAFNYNPATFEQYQQQKDFRLTFFLNPFTTLVSLYEEQHLNGEESRFEGRNFGRALGLFIKGITFTTRRFEGGILFCEESLANDALNHRKKFFSAQSFWEDYSHSLALKLKLAPQVAIGLTTTFYYVARGDEAGWKVGNQYGVLLRPEKKLNVGVFYLALPQKLDNHREAVERLANDSVNLGLAYRPLASTTLAIDLRNINNEKDENAIEPHVGIEQQFGSWGALRSGYFYQKEAMHAFSVGVGLLSGNLFCRKKNNFQNHDFIINYSLRLEKLKNDYTYWHFFSLQTRI